VVALGLVFAGKMTTAASRHSVGQSFVARIITSGSSGKIQRRFEIRCLRYA
jgi:hypothetical protein